MSEASEAGSIHRADPGRRRLLLALLPLGGAALYLLSRWFGHYLEHLPVDSTGQMRASGRAVLAALQLCLYAGAGLLAALALYWHRVSRIMRAAAQYPPPQMRLFHDMRILRGEAKQARERWLRRGAVLAAAGAAAALASAVWMPRQAMRQHPLAFDPALPDHRFDQSYPLQSGKP
ncbi:MAG TPA: hypothetical protein VFA75_21975 [Nevskia sp.]|nr:hypothetical protein [Nevskia sp.]